MGIYDSFEQYLPEMKGVRAQYDDYLKKNNLSKTAEEKLFDYLSLTTFSYRFNKEKKLVEFSEPNIAEVLQRDNNQCIYYVINTLSQKIRYREMQDTAEFSSFVMKEIDEDKKNIEVDYSGGWTYKRFPSHGEFSRGESMDLVRYALNVKPGLGLFKKLDNLCLKYDALDYKIIGKEQYNQRTDPIIIYARKENQKEMLEELESIVRPYRRKDDYETAGYKNLGNGIYVADEIKGEKMEQLKYDLLTKEELNVFTHPVQDEDEQDDREFDLLKKIIRDKSHPIKANLFDWIKHHQYDYAVSNAQYQSAKIIITAYNKIQGNSLSRDYTKPIPR